MNYRNLNQRFRKRNFAASQTNLIQQFINLMLIFLHINSQETSLKDQNNIKMSKKLKRKNFQFQNSI